MSVVKFNPVRVQQDIFMVLRSASALSAINVAWYRKMVIAREVDYRRMLSTPRAVGGQVGAAILVLQPTAAANQTNVSGPVFEWTFGVSAFELPSVNFSEAGTQEEAENWAQVVGGVLHLHADEGWGTLRITGLSPERDFVFPGCVGYRVNFAVTGKNDQDRRVAPVTVAFDAGLCTLACATGSAVVRYTLDGTLPALNASDNAAAVTYDVPFAMSSGQVVRACAYLDGMNNSAVRYQLAP